MMDDSSRPIDLMLVGCGMMGRRHLRGYAELVAVRPGSVRLRAVCDLDVEAAEAAAEEAESLLGYRPTVCRSAEDALSACPEVEAVDVVVQNRAHDPVAIPILAARRHVLLEKPLAVTIERGRRIVDAARSSGRVLAVGENNRRDPMARLERHVLESRLIGRPHSLIDVAVSSGRRVVASPWRHLVAQGGLLLDVAIHELYLLEMLLGPIRMVSAVAQRVWDHREWTSADGAKEEMAVDAPDAFAAALTFASGVHGAWVFNHAAAGGAQRQRTILGTGGTLSGPGARSGVAVSVVLGGRTLSDDELVNELPAYRLNDIETLLFGERPGSYSLSGPETDRKLIAAEVADFVDAIRDGRAPEVDGEMGLRTLAVAYAVLESAEAGQPVAVEDVHSGDVRVYQERVEAAAEDV